MTARIPDHVAAPTFAHGVEMSNIPDTLLMTFILVERDGEHVAVDRVALAPSCLESLYLELGNHLEHRRAQGWT